MKESMRENLEEMPPNDDVVKMAAELAKLEGEELPAEFLEDNPDVADALEEADEAGEVDTGDVDEMLDEVEERRFQMLEHFEGELEELGMSGEDLYKMLKEIEGLDGYSYIQDSKKAHRLLISYGSKVQKKVSTGRISADYIAALEPGSAGDVSDIVDDMEFILKKAREYKERN